MLKQHKGGWTQKIGRLLISRKKPMFSRNSFETAQSTERGIE